MLPADTLKGMLVIELASVLAGPSAGQFFAECGARVLKVENPHTGGDVTRSWRLPDEKAAIPSYFSAVNWGKESLAVDLRTEEGREVIYALIPRADMVIASFRPGSAEGLGMDYETLKKIHPGIIYGSITGYGQSSGRVGYDAVIQAESGFMFLNRAPGDDPMKMPVALVDLLAGHHLRQAMLLALIERMRTGMGSEVSVSLMDAALSSLANQASNYLVGHSEPRPTGSLHPNIAPYGEIITSSDGREILLAIGNDQQFAGLCEVLGIPGLSGEPRFITNSRRVEHRQELTGLLKQAAAVLTADQILEAFMQRNIPAGEIRSASAAIDDVPDHLFLRNGDFRGIRTFALPSEEVLKAPPILGADTWPVLHELLGMTRTSFEELRRSGILA